MNDWLATIGFVTLVLSAAIYLIKKENEDQ